MKKLLLFLLVVALASFLFVGCLPGMTPTEGEAEICLTKGTPDIKTMTYNIHHGEGTDGVIDLDRIASVIQAESPDIVGLNEVDKLTNRSGNVDQAKYLADALGMYYVFGKSINYGGGEYGNAVLSKTPIDSHTVHLLSNESDGEQRTCLEVQTAISGTTINFFVTHLGLEEDERVTHANQIKGWATSKTGPKVVVGDWNEGPTGNAVQAMLTDFRDAFAVAGSGNGYTYANPNVSQRIDFVFICKDPAATISSCTVPSATPVPTASDHRPVVSVENWQKV